MGRPSVGAAGESPDPEFRAFVRGDEAAFARACGVAQAVVGSRGYGIPPDERDDLVQESVLQAWHAAARPGFSLRESLDAFVRSIAYRRCVDWMRQQRRHEDLDPATPAPTLTPDEALVATEELKFGLEAVRLLGKRCRELIRRHCEMGLSYREIARIEGRSEGALRTQMYECLKEARGILAALRRERARGHRDPEATR